MAHTRETMTGSVLEAVVGSARQMIAVVIALLSIAGAGYLLSHKLNNPDHFVYYTYRPLPGYRAGQGYCGRFPTGGITHGIPGHCEPPTRAAWQIPLAVVLVLAGLGAVGVVGPGAGMAAKQPIPRLGDRPIA